MCFVRFLFHLLEVAVCIDFAREKKMFLTGFTHCKVGLWKRCDLGLWRELPVNYLCIEENRVKLAISVLKNRIIQLTRVTGSGKSCFKVCHCRNEVPTAEFEGYSIW